MPAPPSPADRMKKRFAQRPCWMLAPLAKALDYAAITVRRLLRQVGYCRSYTHNGKWYTLRTTPTFNRQGLWHYKDVGFSRYGSLTATIAHLLAHSPTGLSARQLAQALEHPCHAVLTQMHRQQQVDRLLLGGEFRYLSRDAEVNRRQRERVSVPVPPNPARELSTAAALQVFVAYIQQPQWSFEQLAAHLHQPHQLPVTAGQIEALFQAHGLKKTLTTSISDS